MTKNTFNKFKFGKNVKIADIGCGKRNLYMRKLKNYMGIDKRPLKGTIQSDFEIWIKKNKRKFDLIISEYSLQFAKNPQEVVRNVLRSLKKKGYFYFAGFSSDEKISKGFSNKEYETMFKAFAIISKNNLAVHDKPHQYANYPHIHKVVQILAQKR